MLSGSLPRWVSTISHLEPERSCCCATLFLQLPIQKKKRAHVLPTVSNKFWVNISSPLIHPSSQARVVCVPVCVVFFVVFFWIQGRNLPLCATAIEARCRFSPALRRYGGYEHASMHESQRKQIGDALRVKSHTWRNPADSGLVTHICSYSKQFHIRMRERWKSDSWHVERWALAEKRFVDSSERFCAKTRTVRIGSVTIAQLGVSVHPVCFISPDIRLWNVSSTRQRHRYSLKQGCRLLRVPAARCCCLPWLRGWNKTRYFGAYFLKTFKKNTANC